MTRTFMNCHFAAIYILLSVTMFTAVCNSLGPTDFGKEIFEERVTKHIFLLLNHG